MYSVPPTLIGRQVTVRLHHDRLVVFLGSDWVCQLPRAYGDAGEKRAWCIDLEHLIDGLRAKPRALLHCRYQRHLFPDQRWWDFWQQLLSSDIRFWPSGDTKTGPPDGLLMGLFRGPLDLCFIGRRRVGVVGATSSAA